MEITKNGSIVIAKNLHTHSHETPLTKEVLDLRYHQFFPAGWEDSFQPRDGLLLGLELESNSAVEGFARYLTDAERKSANNGKTGRKKKRQDGLQARADECGLPLE